MPVGIRCKRLGFRLAHALLRVYWCVGQPRVTGVKGVVTDGDRLLLVRHTYGSRTWDFPGGSLKRGEPARDAVDREMAEELGIRGADWRALGRIHGRLHRRRDTVVCFAVELHRPALTLDPGELAAAEWFPRDCLPAELGFYTRPVLDLLSHTGVQTGQSPENRPPRTTPENRPQGDSR